MTKILVYLMLSSITSMCACTPCARRRAVNTIRHKDCQVKRVMTFECKGACPDNELGVVANEPCNCCRNLTTVTRLVRVLCPDTDGQNGLHYVTIAVHLPMSCLCQTCSNTQTQTPNRDERTDNLRGVPMDQRAHNARRQSSGSALLSSLYPHRRRHQHQRIYDAMRTDVG